MIQKSPLRSLISRPPATPLFHYTSMSGFLGIIESKSIWASNIHYLNDHKEFCLTLELAQGVIKSRKEKDIENHSLYVEMQANLQLMERTIYVTSFSEDGDSLSQWRAYSGGAGGFSIGFCSDELWDLSNQNTVKFNNRSDPSTNPHIIFSKCVYEKNDQLELINQVIDSSIKSALSPSESPTLSFMANLELHAPFLKDIAFKEEREWRLVMWLPPNCADRLDFHAGRSTIVPHFSFNLKDDREIMHCSEVVVGPTPFPDLSKKSTEAVLQKYGLLYNVVRNSSVPYRNW